MISFAPDGSSTLRESTHEISELELAIQPGRALFNIGHMTVFLGFGQNTTKKITHMAASQELWTSIWPL